MAVVKGTKAHHLKVVRDRPVMRLLVIAAVCIICVTAIRAAYWYGHKQGMSRQERSFDKIVSIRTELENASSAENELRQALENAKLGAEVDRKALEDVRVEMLELKSQLASLDEENQFYRNLMAPAGNQRGLTFGAMEIAATERPRTYRYKVVMQQLATNHEVLNGTLSFNIIGRQEGVLSVLALRDVSRDVDSLNIKLRFKYFQNIEGELVLPEGYEPERIELEARSTGSQSTTIDKRFGWLVQET